ncbi:hypothetical protein LSAT2_022377 [Lamellibrachia satsuma]|nr:hypothetical protein LSAT2_022377 [Lamellibrachia satsuma]
MSTILRGFIGLSLRRCYRVNILRVKARRNALSVWSAVEWPYSRGTARLLHGRLRGDILARDYGRCARFHGREMYEQSVTGHVLCLFFVTLCGQATGAYDVIEFMDHHLRGDLVHSGLRKQTECIDQCFYTVGCISVDFQNGNGVCLFRQDNSLTQYQPRHFAPGQLNTGRYSLRDKILATFRGRHVKGGVYRRGLTTWQLCVQWCTGSCVAVDFDSSDRTCWHHLAREACSATLTTLYSSTHYRMNACGAVFGHRQSLQLSSGALQSPTRRPLMPFAPLMTPICGRPVVPPSGSRIVGGKVARPHSWPWQVALRNRKSRSVRCAGSLVDARWVLTTAHCVDQDPVGSNWLVYTGAHDLTKLERSRARYSVERVILHERFDLSNFDNDIALLKLTTPVHWDTFVKPVCVPPPHYQLQAGTICTITGWGMAAPVPRVEIDSSSAKEEVSFLGALRQRPSPGWRLTAALPRKKSPSLVPCVSACPQGGD